MPGKFLRAHVVEEVVAGVTGGAPQVRLDHFAGRQAARCPALTPTAAVVQPLAVTQPQTVTAQAAATPALGVRVWCVVESRGPVAALVARLTPTTQHAITQNTTVALGRLVPATRVAAAAAFAPFHH